MILIIFSAGLIYLYLQKKLKRNAAIFGFGVLILFDLVLVDKRYVNSEDFTTAISVNKPFSPKYTYLYFIHQGFI